MTSPTVSVLTTAYNRQDYIAQCIESVLASSYSDFEYIIVDDNSTDESYNIAKAFEAKDRRIKVYRNSSNLGDYPNRNKAASYATGKYIKYVDSDNVIYKYGLASMVDCMSRYPEAALGLLSKSDPEQPYPICIGSKEAYQRHFIHGLGQFGRAPDSAIISRVHFEKLGGFSGRRLIGDFEMWLRLAQSFSIVLLPPYAGWDRVHPGQEKNVDPLHYWRLTYQTSRDYLLHGQCPLDRAEAGAALKLMRSKLRRTSALEFARLQFIRSMRTLHSSFSVINSKSE